MHLPNASSVAVGGSGRRAPRLVTAALAAGLLAGGLALGAQPADATPHAKVTIEHRTLIVQGTPRADAIALRLHQGDQQTLQVVVGTGGSDVVDVSRSRFDRIRVDARSGNDRVSVDESNGAFTPTTPTQLNGQSGDDELVGGSGTDTLNGGAGDDNLVGGRGNELLIGGAGNDTADGNQGADTAFLGAGDDRFIWDPGDASDVVEGQAGHDAMTFNGANVAEQFDVSANGSRVRFFRNVGTITMDLGGVEEVDTNALGGADQLTVHDLSGTGLTEVRTDLAGSLGGDDGSPDQVIVEGTNANDRITAAGSAGNVTVTGLAARVDITHAQATQDRLTIKALAGDDVVDGSALAADAIQYSADGGDGNDVLTGGAGADMLSGGAGDDVLNGGPGLDTLDGGPGSNVVIQ